jgi:carbonic anhydrase
MSDITALLERNGAFASSGAWRNTPRLPFLPFKGLYIITCIDPRTDPADFFGLEFGDAIVARSVGGRVTGAVIRDLAYIGYLVEAKAPEGPYFEAAVIHHTDCGSRLLEDPDLRRGFARRSGYDEQQLAALPATVPAETVRGRAACYFLTLASRVRAGRAAGPPGDSRAATGRPAPGCPRHRPIPATAERYPPSRPAFIEPQRPRAVGKPLAARCSSSACTAGVHGPETRRTVFPTRTAPPVLPPSRRTSTPSVCPPHRSLVPEN